MLKAQDHRQGGLSVSWIFGCLDLTFAGRTRGRLVSECQIRVTRSLP